MADRRKHLEHRSKVGRRTFIYPEPKGGQHVGPMSCDDLRHPDAANDRRLDLEFRDDIARLFRDGAYCGTFAQRILAAVRRTPDEYTKAAVALAEAIDSDMDDSEGLGVDAWDDALGEFRAARVARAALGGGEK